MREREIRQTINQQPRTRPAQLIYGMATTKRRPAGRLFWAL